jgi:predicted lysophospholipase L1 biosynthesis ABC-type transport system permease subunit
VAAAAVFGQSLDGLVSHPARYGWSWDRMLVAEAGYGSLDASILDPAIAREPQITSWATLSFVQGTVQGQPLPILGLQAHRGTLTPPITEGRTVRTGSEVVVGRSTLRSLHRSLGDRIEVEVNGRAARLRIVGVAVLPSIGQGAADHTSLGRGLLMRYDRLAQLTAPGTACLESQEALCPQALVFDAARGADSAAIARRIASTDPDGVASGTYEQGVTRAADIRNYEQMRSLPIALALVLALAAVVAFGFALVASARVRQRDLAVLRGLGFTAGQLRTALVTQALVTAALAALVGIPLGIAAGRAQWIQFANSVGVVPLPVVRLPVFAVAVGLTLLVSAVVALGPARLAARSTVGALLRRE